MPKHPKRLQRVLDAAASISSLVHLWQANPDPSLIPKQGEAMLRLTAAYDAYVDPDHRGIR